MRNKLHPSPYSEAGITVEGVVRLQDVSQLSDAFRVRPCPVALHVRFADGAGEISTLEGRVKHAEGDAIVTGLAGEQWPIRRARFLATYTTVSPTLEGQDGLYMKRPRSLWAAELTQAVQIPMSAGQGSLRGEVGDYLVQSSSGELWVVARSLFASTYERL